jgi:hypothetical protein
VSQIAMIDGCSDDDLWRVRQSEKILSVENDPNKRGGIHSSEGRGSESGGLASGISCS